MIGEFRRILVPTDGSARVERAIRTALSLAKLSGATVTALYVVDLRGYAAIHEGPELGPMRGLLEKEGEQALAAIRDEGGQMNVPVKTKLAVGHPSDEILKEAKNHDVVVMGKVGHTGLTHLLLGSVSEKVIRHAPCPVMVVPLKVEGPSEGASG